MKLHTASEVVSLAKELENQSASFYRDLSRKYSGSGDILLSFVKENERNVSHIERTYYGVISDAIEGGFAFDMSPDEYAFNADIGESMSYSDALRKAIEIEEKIQRFYSDAAEQSASLMADLPVAFTTVARRRDSRRTKLSAILKESQES